MKDLSRIEQLICHILGNAPFNEQQIASESARDLVQTAAHHGVQGLLYRKLKQKQLLHLLPETVVQQLRCFTRQQTAVELQRDQVVQHILAALTKNNISALLIKGEGLARTVYADPSLRARGDVDFFIAPDQIQKTLHLFTQMQGFQQTGPVYKSHQFFCRYTVKGRAGFNFDVHWRINNTARFAQTLSFDQAQGHAVVLPETEGGKTLCLEHALLLACMHLTATGKLTKERLIWYYDIFLLVQAMDDKQWDRWAQMAVAKNVQDVCFEQLGRAADFFATSMPAEIMDSLSSSPVDTGIIRRITQSNLGLICHDLVELHKTAEKMQLLRELFLLDPAFLLQKYKKQSRLWLPLLYIAFIGKRVCRRLALK